MLEIAKTLEDLPIDTDLLCPICLEDIDLDGKKEGVPDCVICNNGHRCHRTCFSKMEKPQCPTCANKHIQFCKSHLGYSFAPRKGGKVKKNKKKTNKKKKSSKRRKTCKRKSKK